ncbi:MAG: CidA/LrgA family protein [Trueperaceae bacterium]|nr:CidA/LrgA family protein [Trueperaceae bacterium]
MRRGLGTMALTLADLLVGGALLVAAWVVGEGVAALLPWAPLPGSLWGMLLAFAALEAGWLPEARIRRAAQALVRLLGLLFVPVGVGVVAYGELVAQHAVAIVVAIVAGSVITLLASAAAASATSRVVGGGSPEGAHEPPHEASRS